MLATAKESESAKAFKKNYEKLKFNRVFFFSATPKDCFIEEGEENDYFLMNNEEIFGERIGITLSEAIVGGYVPCPVIHLAIPDNYNKTDMNNIKNMTKFVLDSFESHSKSVKKFSNNPKLIEPKMLIKCKSVDQMWDLYDVLKGKGVDIYAGASRKGDGGEEYRINDEEVKKGEHIESLEQLPSTKKAIVLHFDTLSEGINVAGFTGVMFLSEVPPTVMKLLQNVGRGLRLNPLDRTAIRNGYISPDDYKKWIKPYSYIILPIFNSESEETQKFIGRTIMNLRDNGIKSSYVVSIGSDEATSEKPNGYKFKIINYRKAIGSIRKWDGDIKTLKDV
jgi:hypothetical protein